MHCLCCFASPGSTLAEAISFCHLKTDFFEYTHVGCDASRLRQFVNGFYASRPGGSQNVDDAFHVFVWGLLVRQPSVRVGLVREGEALEVYVAPQLSKRRAAAKPKKKVLMPEPAPFPALDGHNEHSMVTNNDLMSDLFPGRLQPIPEAATSSLETLVGKYGDKLRVAVDPETCFRAITGTHIRVRVFIMVRVLSL
jgi:oxalate---CoA ligase